MAVILMAVGTISILNSIIEVKNSLEAPEYDAFGDIRANVLAEVQNGMEFILAKYTANATYGQADALNDLQQLLINLEQYMFQKGFSLSLQLNLDTFLIEMSGKSELTTPNDVTDVNQNHHSVIAFQLQITSSGSAQRGFTYSETKNYYYAANLTIIAANNTLLVTQQRWNPTEQDTSSSMHVLPVPNSVITYSNNTVSQTATEMPSAGVYTFPSSINVVNGNLIVILPNGVKIVT